MKIEKRIIDRFRMMLKRMGATKIKIKRYKFYLRDEYYSISFIYCGKNYFFKFYNEYDFLVDKFLFMKKLKYQDSK